MEVIVICYDVWQDEETGEYYGDVFRYDRKTRKTTDIITTENVSSVKAVKEYIEKKYPGAVCIHCG